MPSVWCATPTSVSGRRGLVGREGRDVTRRGVSRERADLERAGVSRGVSARAEDSRTRRATPARLASARAPRARANPNDPRCTHLRPMVWSREKTTVRSVARTYLRSRCPPADASPRRASRCPASRTEPASGGGASGEIETSRGQPEVLHRARRVAGNETIALGPLANMQHRAPTFRSVSRERRAAATEKSPRAVLLTYPEPFREPRPRGLDQIRRARGRRGGRHRLARLQFTPRKI